MPHNLNARIAAHLRHMAELLEHQGENGFRSQAYRRAASVVEGLDRSIDLIFAAGGVKAIVELPAIGRGIAAAIAEMITTGHWTALDRLTGELDAEALFATVPGIGPESARRIHRQLHVETLEELEQAASDGRLGSMSGFGERRIEGLRAALRDRLQTLHGQAGRGQAPPIALLLDIDSMYRRKAERGQLKLIAPRRFNPDRKAWLPVMHEHRGDWHFSVLFSNTARAHELHKSHDWVIMHASHDGWPEWQFTVVTETRGPLKGKRVVRGLETECDRHYAAAALT